MLAIQIIGLWKIHSHGMTHCDLKPGNVLIDDNGGWLIGDLGLVVMDDCAESHARFGTEVYMAPEQVKMTSDTRAADIWQLGCVFIEFLRAHEPSGLSWTQTLTDSRGYTLNMRTESLQGIQEAVRRSLNAIIDDPVARDMCLMVSRHCNVYELMLTYALQMTNVNPAFRPAAHHILNHPWFRSIDLFSVYRGTQPCICKCTML